MAERVRRLARRVGGLALVAALVAACGSPVSPPSTPRALPSNPPGSPARTTRSVGGPCRGSPPPATFAHVVWIVMENRGLDEIVGSDQAPYLAQLAAACGLATDYRGVAHPSLPNYIALTSGSTHGITDDNGPGSHSVSGPSLLSLLGSGWRALEESMPRPCDRSSSGRYVVKHNPAVYYTAVSSSCARQDVPLAPLPDVSARFTLITPDLCDDMHDCSTRTGDAWLARTVPEILDSPQYRQGATALFITWDENDSGGSLVPTYVVAPAVPPGTRSSAPFDHYSLLRTTEELLGIGPPLGAAAHAADMRSAFHL